MCVCVFCIWDERASEKRILSVRIACTCECVCKRLDFIWQVLFSSSPSPAWDCCYEFCCGRYDMSQQIKELNKRAAWTSEWTKTHMWKLETISTSILCQASLRDRVIGPMCDLLLITWYQIQIINESFWMGTHTHTHILWNAIPSSDHIVIPFRHLWILYDTQIFFH